MLRQGGPQGAAGSPPRSALILAGGEFDPQGEQAHLVEGPWDLVIAADGGGRHAAALGLTPARLVGDMDSIDPGTREALKGVPTLTFPTAKDQTDSAIAVDWALEQGARRVVIAGGLGTRFDHSLANAQLLAAIARAGGCGVVTDGRQAVYLLAGRDFPELAAADGRPVSLRLEAPAGYLLSVMPLGRCRGLSLKGLRWELDGYDLVAGDTLTVSNEFVGRPAELRLEAGLALVVTAPPEPKWT